MAAVAHTATRGRFSGLTYHKARVPPRAAVSVKITGNISCKITGMPKPLATAATTPPDHSPRQRAPIRSYYSRHTHPWRVMEDSSPLC